MLPAAVEAVPIVKLLALPAVRVVKVPAAGVPDPMAGGMAADPLQLAAVAKVAGSVYPSTPAVEDFTK